MRLTKIIVKSVLCILEAGLYGHGKSFDDKATQTSVVILYEGGSTSPGKRRFFNQVFVAAVAKAEAEHFDC